MWHTVGAETGDGGDRAGKTVLCREVTSSKVMLPCYGENSTWTGIYVVDNVGAVAGAARVRDDGGLSGQHYK